MPAAQQGLPRPARVVHRIAGRVRIQVQGARDDAPFFDEVCRVLAGVPGVQWVRVNPPASCVVVAHLAHDARLGPRLARAAREAGLLSIEEAPPEPASGGLAGFIIRALGEAPGPPAPPSRPALAMVKALAGANRVAHQSTAGLLDLRILLPLLAGSMSLVKARRPGQGTPVWMTLAMFAFNAFTTLHPDAAAGGAAPEPSPRRRPPGPPA